MRRMKRRAHRAILNATPDVAQQDNLPDGFFTHSTAESVAAANEQERCGECADCLWQAEICCEQARAAARLKRLEAACGLFSTAQSLLRRAIASSGDACVEACDDAREKLKNITSEMATYADLAKSAARPMRALHAAPFATSDSPSAQRLGVSKSRAQPDGLAT